MYGRNGGITSERYKYLLYYNIICIIYIYIYVYTDENIYIYIYIYI